MPKLSFAPTLVALGALTAGCIDAATQKPCVEPGAAVTGAAAPAPGAENASATASAGAPIKTCSGAAKVAADGLIDDFEDNNNQVAKAGGRDGYWWAAKDPNGSTIEPQKLAPVDGGAGGSAKALHVTGNTVSTDGAWGVNVGTNFMSAKVPYDGARYAGISFKAKVGPNSTKTVRFKVGDVNTHQDAGICKSCWNHFGKDITLTNEWQEYTVLFSELKQADGWGDPRPPALSPDKLWAFDFTVGPGANFDLWIDDVHFVDCQ
jgi:hypothetical protein